MTRQIKADIFLLLLTVIWGLSFPLMKNVLEVMPSFAYLSLRFIIASVVLLVVFFNRLKLLTRDALIRGCMIGLMLFGGMALQVCGLYYTTASNSAFITGLAVIMVPVVSSVLLKKRPDIPSMIGVILAFCGLFFITGGLNFKFNFGDFLTLLCAGCFTIQIILIDKYTNEYDPALLSIVQMGFAGVLYTVVWLFAGYTPVVLNSSAIFTIVITGVFATALGFGGMTSPSS